MTRRIPPDIRVVERTLFLLAAVLLQAGCAAPTALVGSDGGPSGKIQITSGILGKVVLTPSVCNSGERQLFLGADFIDSAQGTALRLILEPTGTATLRAFNTAHPLNPGVVISQAACRKFQVSLERTGWRINDIYDLRVNLDVDCRSVLGDSVQGMLAVAHCH